VANLIEYFIFIIPLLGIIFNVFYQVDYEGEASSITHFPFTYLYLLPYDGRMKDRNCRRKIINNESIVCGCCVCVCVCVDWIANI